MIEDLLKQTGASLIIYTTGPGFSPWRDLSNYLNGRRERKREISGSKMSAATYCFQNTMALT